MASGPSYAFGEFHLDAAERRLVRGGAAVHLTPKAHDLLVTLVPRAGHLVTKEALLAAVWPDAFVEEGILAVHISSLRKALGDAHRSSAYIETVARSGYRFVALVTTSSIASNGREVSRPLEAYELVGRGRGHLMSASFFELPDAAAAFQAAIALDPSLSRGARGARAHAMRASATSRRTASAGVQAKRRRRPCARLRSTRRVRTRNSRWARCCS